MTPRRYETPPTTLGSLEQRLRNVVPDGSLQQRTRRQIGFVAVIAALAEHARDDDGQPVFTVKGGVAVEMLLGLSARTTKDLDAAARVAAEEVEPRLRDALARGWDGFTFRLLSWDPIRGTAARRGDIKVAYLGRPFCTVQFEAAPAEGRAGRELQFVTGALVDPGDLGLTTVREVPVVTLAYLIAQKLHACTDHARGDWQNDRARDLIDVLLVRRLLADGELGDVHRACVEVFRLRGAHAWPPSVSVLPDWPAIYAAERETSPGFEPVDVYEAAREVDALVVAIDRARLGPAPRDRRGDSDRGC